MNILSYEVSTNRGQSQCGRTAQWLRPANPTYDDATPTDAPNRGRLDLRRRRQLSSAALFVRTHHRTSLQRLRR